MGGGDRRRATNAARPGGPAPRTEAVHCLPGTTIRQGLAWMRASGSDYLVVVEGGRMAALLTEHDLVERARRAGFGPTDTLEAVLAVVTVTHFHERSP